MLAFASVWIALASALIAVAMVVYRPLFSDWGVIAVLYLGSGVALVDLAVRPQLTATTTLLGLGLAALFSVIGSYLPARRAAAAPVAETLREV